MAPFLCALTSSNINRFSKLFHCQNQEKTCDNTIRSHHTSNVSLHYLVSNCKSTTTRRLLAQWRRWPECVVHEQGGYVEHLM